MLKYWMVGLLFFSAASSAVAQGQALDVSISPDWFSLERHSEGEKLQLAGTPVSQPASLAPEAKETPLFKPRLFTLNKVHKYLGIGSLLLASATVLAEKEAGGLHENLADGAAVLGVAAVATGLTFHYDDLKLSNGLRDPDNLHALLGVLGTLGYFLAIEGAGDGTHATAGILGAVSMLYAIKLTW